MKLALLLWPLAAFCQEGGAPPPKATLEGQVVNAVGGEPLRKAQVTARLNVAAAPQGPRAQASGVTVVATFTAVATDRAGKFLFENLEPGTYTLSVRRDGFVTHTLGGGESRKRDAIVLGPGDRKSGVMVKLTPFAVIAGRVVDEDGDPIRGMPATLMSYSYTNRGRELTEGRSGASDDRGEYRIYNIPPGKYLLKFGARGLRMGRAEDSDSFAAAFYPGVAEETNATSVEVRAGQELSGVGITLRKAHLATLRGRIIAPPNVVPNVGLMIVSSNGQSSTSNSLEDKEGKFELFGVLPGQVYVTGSYALEGQRYEAQVALQVGYDDINGIELRPLGPVNLTGQLHIDGQSDVQLAALEVGLQGPGRWHSSGVKEDGSLFFRAVMPAVYRIAMNRSPVSLYLKSVRWGMTDITDGELDLTKGIPPQTELAVVLGADGAQVEGVVLNDKEPTEGARVTLIPKGRHSPVYYKSATTDAAGHFTIRAIAPGPYRLIAWDQVNVSAVTYDPDFLRPYDTAGQNLSLDVGEKKTVELKVTVNQTPADR